MRSLYFDDFYNSAYNEKDISILDRQKFRIRTYNHSTDVIHLERKIKHNNYTYKQIAPLSIKEVLQIMLGEYAFLRESAQPLHNIFYHQIISNVFRPRVIVDYEREPFIFSPGSVRITFDSNIRMGLDQTNLFNPLLSMAETLPAQFLIMEVKYTAFLPRFIRQLLPTQAAEYSAISKYILACEGTFYRRQTDH